MLIDSEKVPAEEMLLLFRQQRVDQVRGAPLLAPVIQIARDLDRYLTATRLQANIAATYGVVIKRDMPAQFILKQTQAAQDGDYRTMPLKTGQMTVLNPGESIEQFRPDVPGNQFDSFAKFLVRMIAIGAGSSYEYVMQDFSGMSFSSSRTTMLDCTLTMQEWQRFLVARFKRKTMQRWLASEMNREALPFNDEAFTSVHWQGPAELGVDPERDANANIQLLAAGLKGYDTLYSEQGRDWKERLRAKADQVKFIQDLATERGVSPELISTAIPPGTLRPGDPGEPPTLARVPGSEGKAQPITD